MLFLRRQLLRTLSFACGSSFLLGRKQLGIAAQIATQPKVSPSSAGAAVRDGIAGGTKMEKVAGIGGLFFRAKDPKALGHWYEEHRSEERRVGKECRSRRGRAQYKEIGGRTR